MASEISTMTKEKGISPTFVLTDLKPNQKTNQTKSQIQFSVKMNFALEHLLLMLKKKSAAVTSVQVPGIEPNKLKQEMRTEEKMQKQREEIKNLYISKIYRWLRKTLFLNIVSFKLMQYKQASSLFWQIIGLILHTISPYIFGKVIEFYKQKSK